MQSGGDAARVGDRALASLLLAHGMIMNGGVHHAIEALSSDELEAAAQGFAYFKLDEVGKFLSSMPTDSSLSAWTEASEPVANETYNRLVPDDEYLAERFKLAIQTTPDDFTPI